MVEFKACKEASAGMCRFERHGNAWWYACPLVSYRVSSRRFRCHLAAHALQSKASPSVGTWNRRDFSNHATCEASFAVCMERRSRPANENVVETSISFRLLWAFSQRWRLDYEPKEKMTWSSCWWKTWWKTWMIGCSIMECWQALTKKPNYETNSLIIYCPRSRWVDYLPYCITEEHITSRYSEHQFFTPIR